MVAEFEEGAIPGLILFPFDLRTFAGMVFPIRLLAALFSPDGKFLVMTKICKVQIEFSRRDFVLLIDMTIRAV